jgi:phospholipid/cholesterol/gamma-HCH transport system permease protein
MQAQQQSSSAGELSFARADASTLVIRLAGDWHLRHGLPTSQAVEKQLDSALPKPNKLTFEASGLGEWDSGLLTFLNSVSEICHKRKLDADWSPLPEGVRKLIELAEAVPEKSGARAEAHHTSFIEHLGSTTLLYLHGIDEFLRFLGEVTLAFMKMFVGKARIRRVDFMVVIQDCGVDAFGIVTLITFLVGVILAFMGAVQLQLFGAQIYVADLVAIAMTRDMGAMMTAIIMAGRTGAAFAAQLGSMKVTQEIDALTTMGISPLEFLVLPRVTALLLMIPLLCIYADCVGILGGAFVGSTVLHLSLQTYLRETMQAVTLTGIFGGVFKSMAYGVIIAVAGCLRGFQCGNSSSAVGDAATEAVVTSITYIVVACGIFAFVFNAIGI